VNGGPAGRAAAAHAGPPVAAASMMRQLAAACMTRDNGARSEPADGSRPRRYRTSGEISEADSLIMSNFRSSPEQAKFLRLFPDFGAAI
jgi:hypothetical protein